MGEQVKAHGGMGEELQVHRTWRNVRCMQVAGGSVD